MDGCHGGDAGVANKWMADHGITVRALLFIIIFNIGNTNFILIIMDGWSWHHGLILPLLYPHHHH